MNMASDCCNVSEDDILRERAYQAALETLRKGNCIRGQVPEDIKEARDIVAKYELGIGYNEAVKYLDKNLPLLRKLERYKEVLGLCGYVPLR